MHPRWVMPTLLVGLLALPAVPGQPPGDHPPVRILEDARGDAAFGIADTTGPAAPQGVWDAIDLTGLHVAENETHFFVSIETGGLGPTQVPLLESSYYHVAFRHHDRQYVIEVDRNLYLLYPVDGGPDLFASLMVWDEANEAVTHVAGLEVWADETALHVAVPRHLVPDAAGALPTPGRVLEDFAAAAWQTFVHGPFPYVLVKVLLDIVGLDEATPETLTSLYDLMPDDGPGATPYAVQGGGSEAFHASLSSERPFRASNGEATTFLYEFHASNLQAHADTFRLTVEGVPDAWDVWFPEPAPHLEAGETGTVVAVAHVPFAHQHGQRVEMTVRLQSATDERVFAQRTVGVVYTEVPQPAGHHDRVWFHHGTGYTVNINTGSERLQFLEFGFAWMNTLPEDGRATGMPAEERFHPSFDYGFPIHLDPGLLMGVDVDMTRIGTVEVPLTTQYVEQEVLLTGGLYWVPRGGEPLELAALVHAPEAVGRDTPTVLRATLEPRHADPMPHQRGAGLILWIGPQEQDAVSRQVLGEDFRMHPGGSAVLPLEEYHDDVASVLSLDGPVELVADAAQRAVNPGESTRFDVTLVHRASGPADFILGVRGAHADWALVEPARLKEVPPGQERTVAVMVSAPADARQDDVADLILEARQDGDDGTRAIARLVARVDAQEDHPDAAPLETEVQETPTGTWLPIGALLAALACARLRGRRMPP